jgi:hypothetical protein
VAVKSEMGHSSARDQLKERVSRERVSRERASKEWVSRERASIC